MHRNVMLNMGDYLPVDDSTRGSCVHHAKEKRKNRTITAWARYKIAN